MPFGGLLSASLIGAGANIFGGILGSNAANNAAALQQQAAAQASQLEQQNAQQAINFQQGVWGQTQNNFQPYLQAGQGALSQLVSGMLPGGSLVAPWTQQFQAPTAAEAMAMPGTQEGLALGTQAINQSAAAAGGALTGGTLQSLMKFGQDYGSTQYQQAYNNALQQYQQAYGIYEQNQANQFNRLAQLAGSGQQAAGQVGQLGQSAAGTVGSIYGNLGSALADLAVGRGNAAAAGQVGSANAWSNSIGGLSNLVGGLVVGSQLGGLGESGYGAAPEPTTGDLSGLGLFSPIP
ncbi:MAG TPA: hypothetical protein VHI13_08895 [Candidatus Kapabacteria bacterium]|nr:hypothetical protein [Candidatus Kapabacteria bacterium]